MIMIKFLLPLDEATEFAKSALQRQTYMRYTVLPCLASFK